MINTFQFSVLGIGVAFINLDMAETYGFAESDMNSALIPSRLRRRMSSATRLALAAGERACKDAGVNVSSMPSVFASIVGEIKITDTLCRNIVAKKLPISPTQFHNSVHNTAAGYWSMVTKNQHATQAIGAGENTLVMGLLESHCQLQMTTEQVLLVCYEEKAPEPLVTGEQISNCAVAFLLGRVKDGEDYISLYQGGCGFVNQSWSAVAKALTLAKTIRDLNVQQPLSISTAKDGWCAKVVKGA
ncbi:MAG: beta-ketoacyl synthase chain length factor [Mariprofundales bacterium]